MIKQLRARLLVAACLAHLFAGGVAVAQEAVEKPGEAKLPLLVPYGGLMLGIIDWSAYGIFSLATQDSVMTDDDWVAAGLSAISLVATSTLLSMEGSGAGDRARYEDPDWMAHVADFQNASVLVASATQGRDRRAFNTAANLLADTCQSCHQRFKDGPAREPTEFASR